MNPFKVSKKDASWEKSLFKTHSSHLRWPLSNPNYGLKFLFGPLMGPRALQRSRMDLLYSCKSRPSSKSFGSNFFLGFFLFNFLINDSKLHNICSPSNRVHPPFKTSRQIVRQYCRCTDRQTKTQTLLVDRYIDRLLTKCQEPTTDGESQIDTEWQKPDRQIDRRKREIQKDWEKKWMKDKK